MPARFSISSKSTAWLCASLLLLLASGSVLPRPPWAGSGDTVKLRSFSNVHKSVDSAGGAGVDKDKHEHYRLSGALVVAVGRVLLHAGCDPGSALAAAALVTACGGLTKELVDEMRSGGSGFDPRDLLADLAGIRDGLRALAGLRER